MRLPEHGQCCKWQSTTSLSVADRGLHAAAIAPWPVSLRSALQLGNTAQSHSVLLCYAWRWQPVFADVLAGVLAGIHTCWATSSGRTTTGWQTPVAMWRDCLSGGRSCTRWQVSRVHPSLGLEMRVHGHEHLSQGLLWQSSQAHIGAHSLVKLISLALSL